MHIRNLGGWMSFSIQIASGAAVPAFPEYKTLALWVFGVSTALTLTILGWWFFANYRISWPIYKRLHIALGEMRTIERNNSSNQQGQDDFEKGFNRAAFAQSATKDEATLRLTQLRSEGVVIRNKSNELLTTSHLNVWMSEVNEWMDEVVNALKPVSGHDSVWFATLGEVPAARVPIPNLRLGGKDDRELFTHIFRQHDYRLARLDNLLKKYGVGA